MSAPRSLLTEENADPTELPPCCKEERANENRCDWMETELWRDRKGGLVRAREHRGDVKGEGGSSSHVAGHISDDHNF